MTQVNFSGSGEDSIENQVGKGQGLQVGITKIDFATGKIQLDDGKTIGNFRTLKKKGADSNEVRSFAFKSKTKCIVKFQDTFIEYNLINEWLILQGIQTEEISITRTKTGLTTDIFDFSFIASDDPQYKISIEKGTRDSDIETVFPSISRAINTYTQNINVQGAKKLILLGKATTGTGTVILTMEVFDPASNSWIELVHSIDLFTLINGESKRAMIGDVISRIPIASEIQAIEFVTQVTTQNPEIITDPTSRNESNDQYYEVIGNYSGYILPSGDNLLRVKAVVSSSALTFSIGAIKVFE